MQLTEINKETVLKLETGENLDYLVHQVLDNGNDVHWLHVPNYSEDLAYWDALIEDMRNRGEYYDFNFSADCFNVIYDFGREVVSGDTILEGFCKAIVLNWLGNQVL